MFETAAEYNFDTVMDAAKVIIKILLPLCVNYVLYHPLSIDFSSCGYIPTVHLREFVLTLKILGDGNSFGNLELRNLDRPAGIDWL